MLEVLKRKEFARWQTNEQIPDLALCTAIREMENGLIDANLGGFLYKKRIARPGAGKRSGYRTILSVRLGRRYVFLHGFQKNHQANITNSEIKALQFAGNIFLDLQENALSQAFKSGVLVKVDCEQNN